MTLRRRTFFLFALLLPMLVLAAFALRSARIGTFRWPTTQGSPASGAQVSASPSKLAGLLPPGALLTIDSPDFAALLHLWSSSPESAAWLQSANYAVFANSRLFGRLSEAQDEFASTAKLDQAGTSLLQQVAGGESVFAWYDIGELQFLYITRMPADRAQQTALFAQRPSFRPRKVGSSTFYLRSEVVPGSTRQRTVAFASVGDLLLLSTREDLMASALTLLGGAHADSLASQPWYKEALAAQPSSPKQPELRMVLDLERIVPMPYFRSYWVQGNISEFKGYRSAVSDLFREKNPAGTGTRFREERTVLLKQDAPALPDDADLGSLAALVPPGTGVFRAQAVSNPESAVALLNERLLTHQTDTSVRASDAPEPDLSPTLEGESSDLETRIDTPAPVSASASGAALSHLLGGAGLQATLALGTTTPSPGLWVPIHSAVVLRTARPVSAPALADALQQALRGSLTASTLGIELRPSDADPAILHLSGPKPLFLAQSSTPTGALILLSDDEPTLRALLTRVALPAHPRPATFLAGFDHTVERDPYLRLTSLIDGPLDPATPATPASPLFFSGNIRSLSDTFSRLAAEQVQVRHDGAALRQTVLYDWRP